MAVMTVEGTLHAELGNENLGRDFPKPADLRAAGNFLRPSVSISK